MLHCGMCIWGNSYEFHVHVTGLIFTVAGTGTRGYNGDGIPATEAQLYRPYDVFVDESGNIYIADTVRDVDDTLCACVLSQASEQRSFGLVTQCAYDSCTL